MERITASTALSGNATPWPRGAGLDDILGAPMADRTPAFVRTPTFVFGRLAAGEPSRSETLRLRIAAAQAHIRPS